MHIVSDLQQRPRKGRLRMEKKMVLFHDLCSLVQLVTITIHIVTTTVGARQTFTRTIYLKRSFELTGPILYKTENCTYNTTRTINAFSGVEMSLNPYNVNDVFVDNAIQMRLGVFVGVMALVCGGANRILFEANFFCVKTRNFVFWKDIISAAELLLLGYVIQIAAASHPPGKLAQDYMKHCGITSHGYLPFVSPAALYTFSGVGYGCYLVGLILYLYNSLPKYGIMTPTEIAEYKEWLRVHREERERSRFFIEEAKKAQARMLLLSNAEYPVGTGGAQLHHRGTPAPQSVSGPMPPMAPMPMSRPMTPEQQQLATPPGPYPGPYADAYQNAYPGGYSYPFPYMEGIPPVPTNANLPQPQRFGMQQDLRALNDSPMRTAAPAARPMAGGPAHVSSGEAAGQQGPPMSVNMPRRRVVPLTQRRADNAGAPGQFAPPGMAPGPMAGNGPSPYR